MQESLGRLNAQPVVRTAGSFTAADIGITIVVDGAEARLDKVHHESDSRGPHTWVGAHTQSWRYFQLHDVHDTFTVRR